MFPRAAKVMLLFDGAAEFPTLEGWEPRRVSSVLQAAPALATLKPEALVLNGEVAWQLQFVAAIPHDQRPAVLVVGGEPAAAAMADEWLAGAPSEAEASMRLSLAGSRARNRRRLARVARRAFVDTLTGLPNRRAVIRALVRDAARASRANGELSLVLIDLDDFKEVNERRGHAGGDRLLRKVGAALRRVTRLGEVCGRIGGDEFALVVPAGSQQAEAAARRVRRALQEIGVSASVASCVRENKEHLRGLYRRTDARLFAAKERRRLAPPTPASLPGPHVIAGAKRSSQLNFGR